MGEDYAKFAGLTAEEDLKEPLKESIKKRLPWLLILLGLGMVVSSVVGIFEQVVSQLTIIMCFQSLILDMAGNVGTQSLAVTIRVLMDESLTGRQKLELVWKEMRIGFSNGLILGVLSFLLIGLYIALFKGKPFGFSYDLLYRSLCLRRWSFRSMGTYPLSIMWIRQWFSSSTINDPWQLFPMVFGTCFIGVYLHSFYIKADAAMPERSFHKAFLMFPSFSGQFVVFEKALDKCEMR
ncbi:MAG: magnesium transporter [Blautia sp.]